MKNIHILLDDKEAEKINRVKAHLTWREFLNRAAELIEDEY
jgi:hypothetical protein